MLTCATALASTLRWPWCRERNGSQGWRLLMGPLVGPCLLRMHRVGRRWWRRWLQRYWGWELLGAHACRAGAPPVKMLPHGEGCTVPVLAAAGRLYLQV